MAFTRRMSRLELLHKARQGVVAVRQDVWWRGGEAVCSAMLT
jgi:hypothetical protein